MSNETNKIDLSRRCLLKVAVAGLLAGIAGPLLPFRSSIAAAETEAGKKKILIAYFSRTGNTREIARQIHERVGGEMIEILTVKPYPEDYEAVKKQAMEEQTSGFKSELKTKVKDIRSYDIIFVGTPIWWGRIATPVKSFLSQYDLSGKTIVPFATHGGSGLGQSMSDIKALCPSSTILDGLAVWGKDAKTAQNKVSDWVRSLGFQKQR